MKIAGIQKLSLIDYPGKLSCVLFLYGCNFRCGFCHNPELVIKNGPEGYSTENILNFLQKRKKYIDGVCITGGEPLMTLDVAFVRKIKEMGYSVKIDTNGTFPEKLKEFIEEELIDFVSMDIKGSKELYPKITNATIDINKIEESIKIISRLPEHEFRTTIIEKYHSFEEIDKMIDWLKKTIGNCPKTFVLQGFKNNGKFIDNSFNNEKNTKESYLEKLKDIIGDLAEDVLIRV